MVFRKTETRDRNRASFIFFIQLDETLPTKFPPLISLGSFVIRYLFSEWSVRVVTALSALWIGRAAREQRKSCAHLTYLIPWNSRETE